MNLEESNLFVEQMEKNNKNKKTVLTILIICAVLIVILFVIMNVIKFEEDQKLKMYINDSQYPISNTLIIQDGETTYMSVRELAAALGFSYQKGEYKKYTEDVQSCYIKDKYQIVSMTADSDTMTKYMINKTGGSGEEKTSEGQTSKELIVTNKATGAQELNLCIESEDESTQIFSLEKPIKYINNELYVAFEELPRLFNVQLDLSQKNRIKINSLAKMANMAMNVSKQLRYSETSNVYENLIAMVDNMLVVGNGTNYGVVSLQTGKEIISLKYEKIVYMQNTQEFFVTAENSVGIVDKNGTTIVKPTEYDSIANLDELKKLYLVEKNEKYGVLNKKGETIIYPEYDFIGIENSEEFQNEEIRNFNLLFEECIPVTENGKVGLIDIAGEKRLQTSYDGLGYVASSSTNKNNEKDKQNDVQTENTTISTDGDSVLTISEETGIKGIVVNYGGLYGIYDVEAKRLIIPCVCERIFSRTKAGKTIYYFEYNDQEQELESYLEANNLKSINNQNEEKEQEQEIQNETIVEEQPENIE